jgi:acyl-CoA thioesterase-1
MLKKVLLAITAVVIVLILLEVMALLHEKASVNSFANYWTQQNKTASGTFTYVALGDSTAQGIGAGKPTDSYVGLLAERVAKQTGKKVRFINLSVTGAKISDVLNKQLAELAQYKPDLVTIEIGANDLANYNPTQFSTEFKQLAGLLPAGTFVSDMPYFGGRIRKNDQALAASVFIRKEVQAHNLHLVNLQQLTRQRQSIRNYAVDLFHPSSAGYVNWADAYWLAIKPALTAPISSAAVINSNDSSSITAA